MSDEIRKDETNEDGELLTARLRAAKETDALSDEELSDVSGGEYKPGDARELNEALADPEALMGDADGWDE